MFLSTLSLSLLVYVSIFLYRESHNERVDSSSSLSWLSLGKLAGLMADCSRPRASSLGSLEDTELFVNYDFPSAQAPEPAQMITSGRLADRQEQDELL